MRFTAKRQKFQGLFYRLGRYALAWIVMVKPLWVYNTQGSTKISGNFIILAYPKIMKLHCSKIVTASKTTGEYLKSLFFIMLILWTAVTGKSTRSLFYLHPLSIFSIILGFLPVKLYLKMFLTATCFEALTKFSSPHNQMQ